MLRPAERKAGVAGSLPMSSSSPDCPLPPLRVLTYNVHSCRGLGGLPDPARIADVIAAAEPDIIALQELDVGRMRTGGIDQAHAIARHLRMDAHFHPALHVEEEKYGDAILTALPSRLVKAGPFPSLGEPRGAIWVEVEVGDQKIQVVNTHFGLRRRERMIQAATLAGEEWLGNPACLSQPAVLAGDFNALPWSGVLDELSEAVGATGAQWIGTFPAWSPVKLPIDQVRVSGGLQIVSLKTGPFVGSIHLPLVAVIALPPR